MAEITGQGAFSENGHYKHTWTGLGNGDTGKPTSLHGCTETSVQVVGTFGSGGSVAIEGSNDGGTTWNALHDPQGNNIALQDTTIETVREFCDLLRPNVTAGDGSTNLDFHLVARKVF